MSIHRRNPRRDKNEREIISALESHGVSVWQLSAKGLPDLLCLKEGRLFLVEVKGEKGRLTPSQVDFFAQYPECPAYVVSNTKDVAIVSSRQQPHQ